MYKKMAKSNGIPELEYSIETDENDVLFDYASKDLDVIGKLKEPARYNLNNLIKSREPKHKKILNSLILRTVQKNLYGGFKCVLYHNYQIRPLNKNNQTALHIAFYSHAIDIITEFQDYLESEYFQKANLSDFTDKNGLTHLHVACAMGSIKLIDTFSKNSANINSRFTASRKQDNHYSGFTLLHFAMTNSRHQNKEMVHLLIERGADINAVDDKGRTPLHIICSSLNSKVYRYGTQTGEVMQALIDFKIDVNAKDATGNIPLFMVFTSLDELWPQLEYKSDYSKLVEVSEQNLKLLLEAGSDVEAKNNSNDTVLHFAVNNLKITRRANCNCTFKQDFEDSRIIQSLELIISHKPDLDVNVKNMNNETPLLLAISYLNINVVRFLLKSNVDLKSLEFDHKPNKFFKSYGISTPKSLENLIAILDLLTDRGFVPKLKDKLAVLKFLIPAKGRYVAKYESFFSATFYIICIESPKHLKNLLDKFYKDFQNDYLDSFENSEECLDRLDGLETYLFCIEAGYIFMNQDSKSLIEATVNKCKQLHYSWSPTSSDDTDEIYEELDELESITLLNDKTMDEVLMEKPEKSAQYFGTNNFDESQLDNLRYFEGIVVGYVTVSLIRYHVINLSYDIVKKLHCTPLSYLCYEFIVNHLSNKDILNLCVAILT